MTKLEARYIEIILQILKLLLLFRLEMKATFVYPFICLSCDMIP